MLTDTRRLEGWQKGSDGERMRLLYCHQNSTASALRMQAFGMRLAKHLGSHLNILPIRIDDEDTARFVVDEVARFYDLVLLDDRATHSPLTRLIDQESNVVRTPSFLIGRDPTWPLSHILLLISGGQSDTQAIQWAFRLAELTKTRVTVLHVLSPAPPDPLQVSGSLTWLLPTGSHSDISPEWDGARAEAERLSCTYRLNTGTIQEQIEQEVQKVEYDFIIAGAEPEIGDGAETFLEPILRLSAAPVLVASPISTDAMNIYLPEVEESNYSSNFN